MTQYKAESHLRSIIKGVSWRIIATVDTVFIVLLITCLQGRCSIDHAIQIGFAEFLLKLLVYFIHERTWQKALRGGTLTQMKILYKSISWRILATSLTFIISGAILNAYDAIALYIALTELFTKFALYYIHERLWLMLPLGRIRRFSSE